jgi:hypothetical protein
MAIDDGRLGLRIPGEVSTRLRMLALVRGERLSKTLTGLLADVLPSAEDLAAQLAAKGDETDGS